MKKTLHLFIIFAIFTHFSAGQRLPVQVYTSRDGLLSNFVSVIVQDSRGYLWIGMDEGIAIYDGYQFKNFRFDDGKEWGQVNSIHESRLRPGVIWIGTNGGGLVEYNNGNLRSHAIGDNFLSNRVNSTLESADGTLWCGTDDGLYRFRDLAWEKIAIPELSEYVKFAEEKNGRIWCFDEKKIWLFDDRSGSISRIQNPDIPDDSVLFVSVLEDSSVAVTTRGASVTIVKDLQVIRRIELPTTSAQVVTIDHEGRYWITTPNGIFTYHRQSGQVTERLLTTGNGLPVNDMNWIFHDRENNLWLGSFGKGLTKIESHLSVQFPFVGMSGKGAVDSTGRLWVASDHGLYEMYRDSTGRWQRHYHFIGTSKDFVAPVSLSVDRNGDLWAVTNKGGIQNILVKRKPFSPSALTRGRLLSVQNGFPAAVTVVSMIDRRNVLWYCMLDGGFIGIDLNGTPAIAARFDYPAATRLRDIREFFQERNGRIWVLGYDPEVQTVLFDGSAYSIDSLSPAERLLPRGMYRAAAQTSDGALWFGSRYNGLYRIFGDSVSHFTVRNGMISNQIWSLAVTESGGLAVGSQSGVMVIPGFREIRFTPMQYLTQSPVHTILSYRAATFAVTRYEATVFTAPQRMAEPSLPPVLFTSLKVNGKEHDIRDDLSLSYGENTLAFEFTAIRFADAGAVKFQYRLDPSEEEWREPTSQRGVTYASLSPGDYVFAVRAVDQEGRTGEAPSIIRFTIASPYWFQWWFLLSIAAVIAAGVVGAEKIRVRRLLEIEKIRSRIAADLHDDIGSGLTRIALISDMMQRQTSGGRPSDDPAFGMPSLTERVGTISRELVDAMGDVVFAIDPANMSMERLLHRVQTFTTEMCEAKDIDLRFDIGEGIGKVPVGSDSIRAVLLVAKEAVTNAVRHSHAGKLRLTMTHELHTLTLSVSDDGKGFDPAELQRMNGLTNMRIRMEKIGGSFAIDAVKGRGTVVTARIPVGR